MKVTIIQTDIVWNEAELNCKRIGRFINENRGSDLYVLPEMFATGFCMQPEAMAESECGGVLRWMQQEAFNADAAIVGSVAVRVADGDFRNRLYFVFPDGSYHYYDKRHLFSYGGESDHYTCGEEKKIIEWRGMKFLLQVCYDLRFPVFSRNALTSTDCALYDAIIYVASWPTSRQSVWDCLLRARAIENQCFVIAVNRVGTDPVCDYSGGSCVVDAYGRTIAETERGKEQSSVVDLDMDRLAKFRSKFRVLADADK